MSDHCYRFWSLDPVYRRVVRAVKKGGVVAPGGEGLHQCARLYQGVHYLYGKALGYNYPEESFFVEKPTASFPAVLYITTENTGQLRLIERIFGLTGVPNFRRVMRHPDDEPYLPPLRSRAYKNEEVYLRSKYNPHRADFLACEKLR